MTASSMTKAAATTTAIESALPLAALLAIAALLPALADEPAAGAAGEQPGPEIADSSSARNPEITTFPYYPALARRDRIEGEATVCFKVAPNGRVLEAEVASSTHEIFEEPALEAIMASTFEPLAPGEELVPTVCRTYRFRLDPVVES